MDERIKTSLFVLPKRTLTMGGVTCNPGFRPEKEMVFDNNQPRHGRYKAGPYMLAVPFSSDETKLIEYNMDDMLDKG